MFLQLVQQDFLQRMVNLLHHRLAFQNLQRFRLSLLAFEPIETILKKDLSKVVFLGNRLFQLVLSYLHYAQRIQGLSRQLLQELIASTLSQLADVDLIPMFQVGP